MLKSELHDYGYFRAAALAPCVSPANPAQNCDRIINLIKATTGCDLYALPELSVTGYTCADLFNNETLLKASDKALCKLAEFSGEEKITLIVGAPLKVGGRLYNCAVAISDGEIRMAVPKINLPNYNEFYEKRWFSSGASLPRDSYACIRQYRFPVSTDILLGVNGVNVGIEICEDLWVPEPPSCRLCRQGADIIVNLSASNEVLGKHRYLLGLIRQQSARCRCGYVYASAGFGESSTDLVFSGNAIIAEDGTILAESPRFTGKSVVSVCDLDVERLRNDRRHFNSFYAHECEIPALTIVEAGANNRDAEVELLRNVEAHPFVPQSKEHKDEICEEIINIQCQGLAQRLKAIHCNRIVIGVSGGLDSTLALLVAWETFRKYPQIGDKGEIVGISMPGLATTEHTRSNANGLMHLLGIKSIEIPIGKAVAQHFSDIGQDPEKHDAAYENSQARERTQILMDYANKIGGIVLGTGDLSELALGWATYNGDHMSMYGINASIPKTLVKHLVGWFADRSEGTLRDTLQSIINTPISPELVPASPGEDADKIAQKTEELVGPYELHDFFLYHTLRFGSRPAKIYMLACKAFAGVYNRVTIKKWLREFYRRFFSQQFKRSCLPDGPKVGSVCLSPRGDWRMPSDVSAKLWLEEIDALPV